MQSMWASFTMLSSYAACVKQPSFSQADITLGNISIIGNPHSRQLGIQGKASCALAISVTAKSCARLA